MTDRRLFVLRQNAAAQSVLRSGMDDAGFRKTPAVTFLLKSSVLLMLGLCSCISTTATAPQGSRASVSDLSFVTNLYNVVDFDRKITEELLAKSPDPRVATLARDLVAEGNSLEARVAPIAEGEGILPPKGERFIQRADLQVKIASVMGSNPIDYDQEYLSDEIYSHEQALRSARAMAAQPGGNPRLMAISTDATAVLQANLTRLKSLQLQVVAEAY